MSEKPNYYAIIPADVRYHKELSASMKLLYGEITALCNKEGYCWATNTYFAELYDVQPTTVSEWISKLKDVGAIDIQIVQEKGNQRLIRIRRGIAKNPKTPLRENPKTPLREKPKHNITSINNTSLNSHEQGSILLCKGDGDNDTNVATTPISDRQAEIDKYFSIYKELLKDPSKRETIWQIDSKAKALLWATNPDANYRFGGNSLDLTPEGLQALLVALKEHNCHD